MNLRLLEMPERRSTSMHEVLAFFRDLLRDGLGADAEDATERFLRCFAGMSFTMPGADFFEDLRRDEAIIDELSHDDSIESRLRILRAHRIPYQYLENLWRIGAEKNLEAPGSPLGRKQAIQQAAEWINRYPSLANDIVVMFALTAKERLEAVELTTDPDNIVGRLSSAARRKPKRQAKPDTLTPYQINILRALKRYRYQRASLEKLSKSTGKKIAPRSVAALLDRGVVSQMKSGELKLTAEGKKHV